MAITPRTIFSNPASATVAAVALLAFSAVGTLAYQVATRSAHSQMDLAEESCRSIREVIGQERSAWSEVDWIVYARCFENRNDSTTAARVANQGLRSYPRSEALYNIAGYHEIVLGQYDEAISTLARGLQMVDNPTSGVMYNNLAWASLWVPGDMKYTHARTLYRQALRYEPTSCETLHTGLWVEYAIARHATGLEEYQALKNFQTLRNFYQTCQNRVQDGRWITMTEVVGATVLFQDVDRTLQQVHTRQMKSNGTQSLEDASRQLRRYYRGSSILALCEQAMPLSDTRELCVQSVDDALKTVRAEHVRRAPRDNSITHCRFRR